MASIISSTDFTDNALADNGITVSRTPVTKAIKSMGGEGLTDGSAANITVIFSEKIDKFTQEKYSLHKETNAYMMTGPDETLSKEDKITYNNKTYRVVNIRLRGPSGSTVFYKFIELHLVTG